VFDAVMTPRPVTVLGAPLGYADGAEHRIGSILAGADDRSSTSAELAGHIEDWETRYHLDPRRVNLLRPIRIEPGSRVLDIGAGLGLLSRFLAERGAEVTALEGAPDRIRAAAQRCAGMDNVELIQGHLLDLAQQAPEPFDLVNVTGVLEYAASNMGGAGGQAAFLDQIRGLCAPDGALVLSIENQLGLKYLMGMPEDHLGRPWVGVEGYPGPPGVCTFSRKVLAGMLTRAGFTQQRWLAPFPDYKLPSLTLDLALFDRPDAASLVDQILPQPVVELANPTRPVAVARSVHRTMVEAGLGPDLVNSFLVVAAGPDADLGRFVEPKSRIWAWSTQRLQPYRVETEVMVDGAARGDVVDGGVADGGAADRDVTDGGEADGGAADRDVTDGGAADRDVTDGAAADRSVIDGGEADRNVNGGDASAGELVVLRRPLHPVERESGDRDRGPEWLGHRVEPKATWVHGVTVEQQVREALGVGDLARLDEVLGRWWEALLSAEIEPSEANPGVEPFVSPGDDRVIVGDRLDVVLRNWVDDGTDLHLIDTEWMIEGGVAAGVVAYRALWYAGRNLLVDGFSGPWAEPAEVDDVAGALCERVGIVVTPALRRRFVQLEIAFQEAVTARGEEVAGALEAPGSLGEAPLADAAAESTLVAAYQRLAVVEPDAERRAFQNRLARAEVLLGRRVKSRRSANELVDGIYRRTPERLLPLARRARQMAAGKSPLSR